MNKKFISRLVMALLCCAIVAIPQTYAQRYIDLQPLVDESTPQWASLMLSPNPNVFEVDRAYRAYYQEHEFEKTTYTQYYKSWRRAVDAHLTAEGFVRWPTKEEQRALERQMLVPASAGRSPMSSPWTSLGPIETYAPVTNEIISWQVNVYTLDVARTDPNTLYCGTEAGGVFKTTDKGTTWTMASAGTTLRGVRIVRIDPQDKDVVYAADVTRVLKTTDGGTTWTTFFDNTNAAVTASTLAVNGIAINPSNSQLITIVGMGGMWYTTDGGSTWTEQTTARTYDIEFKPGDPTVLYRVSQNAAAVKAEFYKSTDSGATWTLKSSGWFNPGTTPINEGGAKIAVTAADPDAVFAALLGSRTAIDDGWLGVWKSSDSGENWALQSHQLGGPYEANGGPAGHYNLMRNPVGGPYQGFYDFILGVSQSDVSIVYVGGISFYQSTDGGEFFTVLGGYLGPLTDIHPDMQEMIIVGNDAWLANDGGINYSSDDFATSASLKRGMYASEFWGFSSGWNEDLLTGGRYHNGNTAFYQTYGAGNHLFIGGAEQATGYVVPGGPEPKALYSDLGGGGRIIPTSLSGAVENFAWTKFPNQSIFSLRSSEVEFDPRCYGHAFLGQDNQLWKTEDGGITFTVVHTFGADPDQELNAIEISRSNPDVLYVFQLSTSGNNGKLWRTADGGATWTEKTLKRPTQRGAMSLNMEDEDELYFTADACNGCKYSDFVWKTTDGGDTWANITGTNGTLDNENPRDIVAIPGSNGGVYLASNNSVFYIDNSMGDWMACSSGLPLATETNRLRPFYRDGKIRMGSYNRGIWESPLVTEPSVAIAQPTVDKLEGNCTRDIFYFDDYSVLNHAGASWAWAFSPAPASVSDPNIRNPEVVFGAVGTYTATLTVTPMGGSPVSNSITITIAEDLCAPDEIPGQALECSAVGDFAETPDMELTASNLTFTAWIKPDGIQNDFTAIFMNEGPTSGLIFREGNNTLGYFWPGGQSFWDSNLEVPAGEWSHVAMVVADAGGASPSVTLYLNGVSATQNRALTPAELTILKIGRYRNFNTRNYKGLIDEVAIYDRALSQDEIRELRHLTRQTGDNLYAYYQFNEPSGAILDKVGIRHATLVGGAARVASTAPVGGGTSHRLTVAGSGTATFTGTGLSLVFPGAGTYPNGELVGFRLNLAPDQIPGPDPIFPDDAYWIVNNYGTNQTFTELQSITFGDLTGVNDGTPNLYSLFKRGSNAEGATWGASIDDADSATPTSVTFGSGNGLVSFSQLVMGEVIPPVTAICQDLTVSVDGGGQASITPAQVDDGSSSTNGAVTLSLDVMDFDCTDLGDNTVTLTVTDNTSAEATCTAVITVEDNMMPTAICQDVTVQLNAAGTASITAVQVSNGSDDNCSLLGLNLDRTDFSCVDVGPQNVTLTATDATGNASTCSAALTVEDNVAPAAVCQDITVQLDAAGNASITPAQVDGGSSDACGIAGLSIDVMDFTCATLGAQTVTLTVTDVNGNASTCPAGVTVEDNVAPTAVCQDITVQLDASGNASITPAQVDGGSSDACGIGSLSLGVMDFTCAELGAQTVTLTVTDVNGNASTCPAGVTVLDDTFGTCDPSVCINTFVANLNAYVNGLSASSSVKRAITRRLDLAATKFCNGYSTSSVISSLNYVISYVQYQSGGNIPTSDADYIIGQVNSLIDALNDDAVVCCSTASRPATQGQSAADAQASRLETRPNPFSEQVSIRFYLPETGPATLEVFNLNGQRVWQMASAELEAGSHERIWDGNATGGQALAPGVYLLRLQTKDEIMVKRLMLVR